MELRANHLNNNIVNNISGSSNSIIRRPPLAPTRLASTSSAASTPSPNNVGNSPLNTSHPLGGSHGNLQQPNALTPKVLNVDSLLFIVLIYVLILLFQTPPSSYRRQIDLQYNSLPRQSFPTLVSAIENGHGPNDQQQQQALQQSTPKQRNVAFGKNQLSSASTPTISNCADRSTSSKAIRESRDNGSLSASNSNIYHHQLVLYQPGQLKGFENKRGFSVPNLGFSGSFLFSN